MANRLGQQLGNYRLIRLLGRGGFAEVYLGEHIQLGTQAAIKVLHTHLARNDEESFLTEARTIGRLAHQHILRVFDFDVQEGVPFLVMDYALHGTLRDRHPKGSLLPPDTVVLYVKQVADALQYAHDEKLIHRDVKPENMLLGRRNEVLLGDFGIATAVQSSQDQNTQEMVGTMSYMAPEQIQGRPRPASDQYALGIVVYEWLSGSRPFHGSFTEIAIQHTLAPPPSLREKVATISPDVERVVLIALEKDSHRRFATVRAFATALEQAARMQFIAPISVLTPSAQPVHPASPSVTPPVPPIQTLTIAPLGPPSTPSPTSPALSLNPPLAATMLPIKGLPPIGTLLSTYRAHTGWVHCVAWAPDGRRIASANANGTVQIWDTANGNAILTYQGHTKRVNSLAWSPDSSRIASASNDKTVQVWDGNTGTQILVYGGHMNWVNTLAWSPGGEYIVSASDDRTVQVWDAVTGRNLFTYRHHSGPVNAVVWVPNGRRIASASDDKTVQVWDVGFQENRPEQTLSYQSHTKRVNSIAWSPDGTRIASGGDDKTIHIWGVPTGNQILIYRDHTRVVTTVAWSSDGRRIASGSYKTVLVWDTSTGQTIFTYPSHSDWIRSVVWSPDGRRIASAGDDKTVQVWTVG